MAKFHLPAGDAAFNHLLNNYKQNARNKGIVWGISKELFRNLTKLNCSYCGSEPKGIWKGSGPNTYGFYIFNGVDRINNVTGYIPENVVPCCSTCNLMKRMMTVEAFITACKAVVDHWNSKKSDE